MPDSDNSLQKEIRADLNKCYKTVGFQLPRVWNLTYMLLLRTAHHTKEQVGMHCETNIESNIRMRRLNQVFLGKRQHLLSGLLSVSLFCTGLTQVSIAQSDEPSPKLIAAMGYKPRQAEVNYELIPSEKIRECLLEAEAVRADGKGFWVTGPGGQPLRWFADTNQDNRLDQWSYYNAGVEVYRENDTDANGKADQYRWLSTEGLRWGIDSNEDGEIDNWTMISAEETSAETVRATVARNSDQFARLLITPEEIKTLGLGNEKQQLLLQRVNDAKEQFKAWASGQNVVSAKSKWTNFGADKPGIVPAGTDGSSKDIVVYENAVALLEDNGETRQLMVGTMIQVDNRWRLVDLPRGVVEGEVMNDTGVFFSASFTPKGSNANGPISTGISKSMERLVTELQEIDEKLGKPDGNMAVLQARRADVLEKLISASDEPVDRTTWIQQFADTVSTAAQTGEYPDGVQRLQSFAAKLESIDASQDEISYVAFRTLTADHNFKMQQPKAEYETLQKEYLDELRAYVKRFPTSKDSAEAMIQIALSAEFTGDASEAAQWYAEAAKSFGDTLQGKKAAGAILRLNLAGKPFNIKGPTLDGRTFASESYLGRPVIYHCWASWCEGCKAEMRALKELKGKYAKYNLQVVGINLDNDSKQGAAYLKANPFPWVHIYDEGGLDSTLAVGYGVLTLPSNFVVDAKGKVIKSGVHWTELDGVIEGMIK
jgi:thiol-disulfide isomerase/thioredoxin